MAEARRYTRQTADTRRLQLIEAARRCLERQGIDGFTVDEVSREAGVSRSLINHHFDGIGDLLAAVYQQMTDAIQFRVKDAAEADAARALLAVVESLMAPDLFSRDSFKAWLALWSEAAGNEKLRAAHRASYAHSREALAAAIERLAKERSQSLDAPALASTVIALIDGLWIEWCLDPAIMTRDGARLAVIEVLQAHLGPL